MLTVRELLDIGCGRPWPFWAYSRGSKFQYALEQSPEHLDDTMIYRAVLCGQPQFLNCDPLWIANGHSVVAVRLPNRIVSIQSCRVDWYQDQPYWHLVLGSRLI